MRKKRRLKKFHYCMSHVSHVTFFMNSLILNQNLTEMNQTQDINIHFFVVELELYNYFRNNKKKSCIEHKCISLICQTQPLNQKTLYFW